MPSRPNTPCPVAGKRIVAALAPALLGGLLTACSGPGTSGGDTASVPAPDADRVAYAETAVPADPRLAAIYDRSCRSCHSLRDAGAPLTGHAAAWSARMEGRSLEDLVAATWTGTGGMPARGLCMDCTDEDFRRLIAFMAKEGE